MGQLLFIWLMLFFSSPTTEVCLTQEEKKLYDMINEYRKEKKLPPIPFSAKLSLVAKAHAVDLSTNYAFSQDNPCNPHSWSDRGEWSACCYTNDHSQAECMWNKPREIAGYDSEGYEIAYIDSEGARADRGLEGWKKSPGHNPLLINSGQWKQATWRAMGIGIHGEFAVVWFGQLEDPSIFTTCANP
jgi:hypothetical protein